MPGEYLREAQSRTASLFSGTGIGNILLYIIAAAIVVLVILMLSGVQVNISSFDPRPRKLVVASQSYKYWSPSGQYTNFIVDSDAPTDFTDSSYSLMMEIKLLNSRNYGSTEGPYRHIFHRGSDELQKSTVGGAILNACSGSGSTAGLPKFGLPKRLNPGIFLDPNTNDILVFVDTLIGNETSRESVRIQDLPLDTPFRLGVVLNGRVLEVYLNCKLEVTKVLTGVPKIVENVYYGLVGSAAAAAMVQNLSVWKSSLVADDMRTLCPALPTFLVDRPICNGAEAVTPTAQNVIQSTNINLPSNLGFGKALQKCAQ